MKTDRFHFAIIYCSLLVCFAGVLTTCKTAVVPAPPQPSPVHPPKPPPCPTELSSGEDAGDLKLHILGNKQNVIEVYFHNQGVDSDQFKRLEFPDSESLNCEHRVVLAPKNPAGTFAVIHGAKEDQVRVFGWKAKTTSLEQFDLPITKGPVRISWQTGQILRAQFGPAFKKECVVEFFGEGDDPFKVLFAQ